jgi:CheY-like chemotaxis protein
VNDLQLRVLVVDDSRDCVHILGALLKTLGCAVTTCSVATECVHFARLYHPHLIFLDIAMPQKNGFDVARELRNAELPPFYLVALTGYDGRATEERCEEAAFDRHLLKPIHIDQLREAIQSAKRVAALT